MLWSWRSGHCSDKRVLSGIGYIAIALALGFVAYGLSIFMYVRAQNVTWSSKPVPIMLSIP